MKKVILITGATDGIGFETAKSLVQLGHHVIVHGRSESKAENVIGRLASLKNVNAVNTVICDLSNLNSVRSMVSEVTERFGNLDVLINNAGVYATSEPTTEAGLDVRFAVNTLAPYLLTKQLLPSMSSTSRVVNLSSAAQAPVKLDALKGNIKVGDGEAYAQSKLALTMWSHYLGAQNKQSGPMIVSVNPKSLLGSKMVKEAYGIAGGDIRLGAEILVRAALSDEFATAHGCYYDNDIESFSNPHPDAMNTEKIATIINTLDSILDN